MKKYKSVLKILIILAIAYAIFVAVVAYLFNSIQNNPIDAVAMPYLISDKTLTSEYGEFESVARYVSLKSENSDDRVVAAYSLKTKTKQVIVLAEVIKDGEEWVVNSYEIDKVRDIHD